jgi:hypothetical protein
MAAAAKPEMEHPPYNDMIADAIATLADRGGSSLQAIKKHIGSKYKLKEGWERKVHVGSPCLGPLSCAKVYNIVICWLEWHLRLILCWSVCMSR